MGNDGIRRTDEGNERGPGEYVPPALEVLGSVEALTKGPLVNDGDVPTGGSINVISF